MEYSDKFEVIYRQDKTGRLNPRMRLKAEYEDELIRLFHVTPALSTREIAARMGICFHAVKRKRKAFWNGALSGRASGGARGTTYEPTAEEIDAECTRLTLDVWTDQQRETRWKAGRLGHNGSATSAMESYKTMQKNNEAYDRQAIAAKSRKRIRKSRKSTRMASSPIGRQQDAQPSELLERSA